MITATKGIAINTIIDGIGSTANSFCDYYHQQQGIEEA
jgi:hypothetical protein